jgi:hypothetical protein
MATSSYPYNQSLPWEPQPYESNYTAARTNQKAAAPQVQRLRQESAGQNPRPAKPMPKARALGLVHRFKRGLLVASLAGFLAFGGLAASHQVGAAASQTSSTTSHTTSTSSSQASSKSFLNQKGGNTNASKTSSKASTSKSSSSTSSSQSSSSSSSSTAVSGSSVS